MTDEALRVVIANKQAWCGRVRLYPQGSRRRRGRRGCRRCRGRRRGRHGAHGHPHAQAGRPRGHWRILAATRLTRPRIIILTTYDLDHYVYAALNAGASGFLLKDVSPEHLVAAVRLVRSGDALLAPAITRRLIERFAPRDEQLGTLHRDLSGLTPRELDVLRLLAKGPSNAELAAVLHLSEATVKTHVARILAKLGLRDRAQAIIVAYETGLITPGGAPGGAASGPSA